MKGWAAVYINNECFFGDIVDVAANGIALLTPFEWKLGQSTHISFSLPETDKPITVKATVARCGVTLDKSLWGMRFVEIKDRDQGQIELYVRLHLTDRAREKYRAD